MFTSLLSCFVFCFVVDVDVSRLVCLHFCYLALHLVLWLMLQCCGWCVHVHVILLCIMFCGNVAVLGVFTSFLVCVAPCSLVVVLCLVRLRHCVVLALRLVLSLMLACCAWRVYILLILMCSLFRG